jgi:hypothetical protein
MGVLDATKPGPKCVQRNVHGGEEQVSGQEDCLFINVYTPHVSVMSLETQHAFGSVHVYGFNLSNHRCFKNWPDCHYVKRHVTLVGLECTSALLV